MLRSVCETLCRHQDLYIAEHRPALAHASALTMQIDVLTRLGVCSGILSRSVKTMMLPLLMQSAWDHACPEQNLIDRTTYLTALLLMSTVDIQVVLCKGSDVR